MYTVALVQNQSEMAHYGYADARPLLDAYDVHLLTGDKIGSLPGLLATHEVDAVILGSNALNDRTILNALNDGKFARSLGEYLDAGRGILCLQQLGLAMRAGPTLRCLPDPLGALRPIVPPRGDAALTSAEFAFGSGAARHVALTYPHAIDPAEVRAHAAGFSSLPGLYWHYLGEADLCDWDELIVDRSAPETRPLVVAAKQSGERRVVVSALPLDWQKHEELFTNLLVYVIEGQHNIATVHRSGEEDDDYHYLRESLRAQRVSFGAYSMPEDAERAATNVELGIHSTLLLSPDLSVGDLPEPLHGTVGSAVQNGRLRLVDIGPGAFDTRSMSIVSRELRPQRLLEVTELRMQAELRNGYIDDSFWSHVETLQTIEMLPRPELAGGTADYSQLQDEAWKIVANHDRDGSYDEIFGATCALYWLRAQYRGVDSEEAERSARWLRGALDRYAPDERALAYLTFARLGRLTDAERADLEQTVSSLDMTEVSETQCVQYLRASLMAGMPAAVIASLSSALLTEQRLDGIWIDLTTTATVTTALLYARAALEADGTDRSALIASIDYATLGAVVYILRRLARAEASPNPNPYPWDGKASTTVKCLQAWLKFDELQDLPVFDILDALRRSDASARQYSASRTALGVLQETNEENARLRRQEADTSKSLATTTAALEREKRLSLVLKIAAGTAGLALYFVIFMLFGALTEEKGGFDAAFRKGILDLWTVHSIAAVPLAGGLLTLWRRSRNRAEPAE